MSDALIKLIIYAAMAAAVSVAVGYGWHHYIAQPYRDEGAATKAVEVAPVMGLCAQTFNAPKPKDCAAAIVGAVKDRDAARAANDAAKASIEQLRATVDGITAELDRAHQAELDAQARARAAIAKAKQESSAARAEVDRLTGIINRKPSTETCGGICARVDAILRSIVIDSVLD